MTQSPFLPPSARSQCDWDITLGVRPLQNYIGIELAQISYQFSLPDNVTFEHLMMRRATWTTTYQNSTGVLSLFADDLLLGTRSVAAPLFDGNALFGPNGIATLYFGVYGSYSDGVLTPLNDNMGLFGELSSFHLWNRTLNASEIAQVSSRNLSGIESGMAIDLRFDQQSYGARVVNRGSAGPLYDAVLGEVASGVLQTSNVFGSGCDALGATSPTWVNRTGNNTAPIANNATAVVVEATSIASTSVTIYFTGSDADGDTLDYMVTRLPTHGVLQLEYTLDVDSSAVTIVEIPFLCWNSFSRYRLAWWPEEGSNEDVSIGFKAWDGSAFSSEASMYISVTPVDGVPVATAAEYTLDEDEEVTVTLSLIDADSDFVALFISGLPSHGALFTVAPNGSKSERITAVYSAWDVQAPIVQHASSVLAVSSFWVASDGGNAGRRLPDMTLIICP